MADTRKRRKLTPTKKAKVASVALQYWAFTWNANNHEVLPILEHLITFLGDRGWRWVFQHEKVTRDHYQGRIDLKNKADRATKFTILGLFEAAGFDTRNLTLSPESTNSVKSDGLSFYVTKPDRVAGPWADPTFEFPEQPIKYEGNDLACMNNPLPWQQEMIDIVAGPPDDRSVVWVFNAKGNIGKSKLQKWMCWKMGAKRVPLGSATQIKHSIAGLKPRKVYLCNLPRTCGDHESQRDLFSALEDIKDGWVESVMYGKDRALFMEPPHLWIFSNDVPDLRLASPDRWVVYNVETMQGSLRQMPLSEVYDYHRKKDKTQKASQNPADGENDEDDETDEENEEDEEAAAEVIRQTFPSLAQK